jgi:hypothetical protein
VRDLLEPARGQLVDVGADPGHADPLGDDQQGNGHRPQHRPRQAERGDRNERGAGLFGDPVQRGSRSADAGQPAAAPGRLGRDGQGLGGATRAGHRDDGVGRADPARQPLGLADDHLDRAAEPGHGVEHLPRHARAAHARHHDGARPAVRGKGRQVGFRTRPHRGAHLRRRRSHLAQHVTGIGRLDHVGRVEPVRGQDELGPAPAVQVVAHVPAG